MSGNNADKLASEYIHFIDRLTEIEMEFISKKGILTENKKNKFEILSNYNRQKAELDTCIAELRREELSLDMKIRELEAMFGDN